MKRPFRTTAVFAASVAAAAIVAGTAIAHPHVTRRIRIPLEHGEFQVQYFTVPYNASHLDKIPEGYLWHLGFASIDVGDGVTTGGATVPAGKYHLFARLGDGKKAWSLVIVPQGKGRDIAVLGFQTFNEKDAEKQKGMVAKLNEMAEGKIVLPTEFRREKSDSEHLSMTVEDRGVNLGEARQGNTGDVKSLGHDFVLHVDFGELHGSVTFDDKGATAVEK